MKQTEVCIVGAGPAGVIAALFLAKKGISAVLVDKAKFPRDKICGDGISGWVLTILKELDLDILQRLSVQPFLSHSHGIRLSGPNGKEMDLPFLDDGQFGEGIPPGFICKRIDFDHFMIEEVKKHPEIELIEETTIDHHEINEDGVFLTSKSGLEIKSKLVIFANGANSKFSKSPGNIVKDKKWTMSGIKSYYKGITGFHERNYVELHFLKGLLPGYFWIFPLPNGEANVGVGLDQYRISKKKINLKKLMLQAIESNPHLRGRFVNAKQITPVQAYGLPLWDKKRSISGERFMLAGDAASLIDPVTGEGIGHATISGMYAAIQAARAIDKNDFSGDEMKGYETELYNRIGKELSISRKIPFYIQHEWLFNMVMNRATNSKILQEKLTLAMTDLEIRKKLKNPWLYLKVMIGM
jgi:geranylgeranyl reductase family protein